jgi:elongation factor Ts
MAMIKAQLVKELREKTGAGMMDCKMALTETKGDFEAAIDWLRTKGLAKAAKKSDRVAAEGLIGVITDGKAGALVEVNSETDFVARNAEFQKLVTEIVGLALKAGGDKDKLLDMMHPTKKAKVADVIKELVGTIGENMTLRRTAHLKVKDGVVASYVHNQIEPGLGKIGVLVALESTGDPAKLADMGRKIAMHIAANNPLALTAEDVSKDVVERERAIFAEQARESGKPANVVEKMVEGRLRKFFEEVVLLKQSFVMDPDKTVEDAVKAFEKEAGAPVKLAGYVRFGLGEGIEKKEDDFAAEVAAAAAQGAASAPKAPVAKSSVAKADAKPKSSAPKAATKEKPAARPAAEKSAARPAASAAKAKSAKASASAKPAAPAKAPAKSAKKK